MKQLKTNIAICLFVLSFSQFASAQPTSAISKEKAKLKGNVDVNYKRRYLWRGQEFGNDFVSQPEINLEYKNFRLYMSSYFNLKPSILPKEFYTKQTIFDEQDIEIGYAFTHKKFDFEFLIQNYDYYFQLGWPDVTELTANIDYNINDKAKVFMATSYGIRGFKNGVYNLTGLSYTKKIGKKTELNSKAYVSASNATYNNNYFFTQAKGVTYIGAEATYTRNFKNIYIYITGENNWYTNSAIKNSTQLKTTQNFIIGVGYNL